MTIEDIKTRLRKLYVDVLKLQQEESRIPDSNLVAELGLDSLNSLELLVWVENTFNIQIEDEDLTPKLVDSLDTLSSYIDVKLQGCCAAGDK